MPPVDRRNRNLCQAPQGATFKQSPAAPGSHCGRTARSRRGEATSLARCPAPPRGLIDPQTLVAMVRYVEPKSEFHRLARFLETYINE